MAQEHRQRSAIRVWGSLRAAIATVAAVAAVCAVCLLDVDAASASASGSEGPGGTVSVGASDGGSSAGSPGTTGAGGMPGTSRGGTGSGTGAGGGSPWACTSTSLLLNDLGGFAPGGPTPGGWYSVTCIDRLNGASTTQTEWIPSAAASPPSVPQGSPGTDPRGLALQAENSLRLPAPDLHFNPAFSSVVNLPTWLWIGPSIWHPLSVTATAGSVSATAVATPVSVTWETGDGGQVVCGGPGRPFDFAVSAQEQETGCQHTYWASSIGQPSPDGNPDDAAYRVRATVTWSVSWAAVGVSGQGVLPPLTTAALAAVRVVQVESVNSGFVGLSARPGESGPRALSGAAPL
jgi:hypothetical protein